MSLFDKFMAYFNIGEMLYMVVILVISLPFHEFAHALAAHWLGDDTAKRAGRLTLNPLRHLDVVGSICLVLFRFGWAKPTPVNPMNFKNPKGGMALTAAAGPVSNLLLAFVSEAIFLRGFGGAESGAAATFFYLMAAVNIGLAVFNLIPVPPLDGSKILFIFLPDSVGMALEHYGQWLMVAVMLLIFTGWLNGPISFIATNVYRNFGRLILAF